MLYVFFGNDTIETRKNALAFVEKHSKKDVSKTHIDAETYQKGMLENALQGESLFGEKQLYVIDTPSQDTEFYDNTVEHLKECAESPHTFVVIEEALLTAEKKKFTKYAETIEEYKRETEDRFNTFSMADSLSKKDKKTLWIQLQDARHSGLRAEEIIGVLWWQLKSLRLAKLTKTAAEADMKDYPYNKAKRALSSFKDGEIETLSDSLLRAYHDGHSGKRDIDIALEKWVLTI